MNKSQERINLENKIFEAHKNAIEIALQMVQEEFNGDINKALFDEKFISNMQKRVKPIWKIYRGSYKELEKLEEKENYLGMREYAKVLDEIKSHIPTKLQKNCYYPFSGTDFYWARIFEKTTFEDIGFNLEELPNMWWETKSYNPSNVERILKKLKEQDIIPIAAKVDFLSSSSEKTKENNRFNKSNTTLLVKGGHDFLSYIENSFDYRTLAYGAIIIVTANNPLADIESKLKKAEYQRKISLEGTDFLAPFSMELKDIHLFIKNLS